jgi:class 3 adenylate cyclase
LGDAAWRTLKAQYDEKVSTVLTSHGGLLVDTSGDGVFARFGAPRAAIRAAQGIVSGADRIGLPTRAGVHTGEVELKENTVTGMTVHIGARVMAHADAGEVLVTSTTRDLTLDGGFDFEEKGHSSSRECRAPVRSTPPSSVLEELIVLGSSVAV